MSVLTYWGSHSSPHHHLFHRHQHYSYSFHHYSHSLLPLRLQLDSRMRLYCPRMSYSVSLHHLRFLLRYSTVFYCQFELYLFVIIIILHRNFLSYILAYINSTSCPFNESFSTETLFGIINIPIIVVCLLVRTFILIWLVLNCFSFCLLQFVLL